MEDAAAEFPIVSLIHSAGNALVIVAAGGLRPYGADSGG